MKKYNIYIDDMPVKGTADIEMLYEAVKRNPYSCSGKYLLVDKEYNDMYFVPDGAYFSEEDLDRIELYDFDKYDLKIAIRLYDRNKKRGIE